LTEEDNMHAVFGIVSRDRARLEEQRRHLQEGIAPTVSAREGFVAGYWSYDETTDKGAVMVVFETRQQALEFQAYVEANEPRRTAAGVRFEQLGIEEVLAHA
jgi:hypothetical protein